MGKTIIKILY